MEGEKIYAMCESIIRSRRNSRLVLTLLKFDRSLTTDDLINDVYIHHHVKGIYPSTTTVVRCLMDMCKKQFSSKRVDCRNKVDIDDLNIIVLEGSIVGEDSLLDIKEAIKKLSKRERDIIYLYFYMGMTYEEIGIQKGKTSWTIRLYIKEAIRKIRREIN